MMSDGGSSVDAVQSAIMILEDSGLFDAGQGAVYTMDGTSELDASIMNGKNLEAGAVANVKTVKNPILAARKVMDHTKHTLIGSVGAEKFLDKFEDVIRVSQDYFGNEYLWQHYLNKKQELINTDKQHSTVGAVAMDSDGNLAAGTSTGGLTCKMSGRIGDSPLIGSGNYADNRYGAVSCTGSGDIFIRIAAAHSLITKIKYQVKDSDLVGYIDEILSEVKELGGVGGMICLDRDGNIGVSHNADGMYYGEMISESEQSMSFD